MRAPPYPAVPISGVRCGCVCLGSGLGCALALLAGMLGCVCVFVCALRSDPATTGWGVRCGYVCLGSGCGCTPPLLAGVLGCVCVCVRASLVPRHSWLGCAVWVCVLGLGLRLRPATPGWGVGVCVCLCVRFACTPPLLAGVCRVGVFAWARVFGCVPPLLAGVLGCVCVCVRAPLVPRHFWLGCAVRGWVFWLGFRMRPATPSWGVGECVCLCARSACTLPLLAEVCGVGVCGWARVPAAPRHSWLGCCGVCVFVCALRLYPATPGYGVRCGCVCVGSGCGCEPPLLAGVLCDCSDRAEQPLVVFDAFYRTLGFGNGDFLNQKILYTFYCLHY